MQSLGLKVPVMLKFHLLCPGRAQDFPKEPWKGWLCLTAAPIGCKAEQSISVSFSCRLRCLLLFCSLWLYPYWSHPANSTSQIQLGDGISFFMTVWLSSSLCPLGSFFALQISEKRKAAHFTGNSTRFPEGFVYSAYRKAETKPADLSWQDQVMEVQAIHFMDSSQRTINAFWLCLSHSQQSAFCPSRCC